MKNFFTLTALAFALAGGAQAQTYNLFPAWATDSDGWLWFNSQDKIDAYVGTIDNDTYAGYASGKIIQTADANFEPYAATTVSATETGVGGTGDDAAVGGPGAMTGAIVLAPASGRTKGDGGGILLKLPSLSTLSLSVSSTDNKFVIVRATKTGTKTIDQYDMVFNTYNIVFRKLSGAGIYTWNGVERLTNAQANGIVSSDEIYVFIQNSNRVPLYIHGIKITTPKQETTDINGIVIAEAASETGIYGMDGRVIKRSATAGDVKVLDKGLYIIRSGGNSRKIVVR